MPRAGRGALCLVILAISLRTLQGAPPPGPGAEGDQAAADLPAIYTRSGKLGDLLRKWYAEGTAAGNTGDFYDNRDGGHSRLNTSRYCPQVECITYTKATRNKLGWAGQNRILPHVTFGNSSTSDRPTRSGSNPRQYYRSAKGMAFLYEQYRRNNHYVYPEHRDHDVGRNGRGGYGDVYMANTPYLIISQGSSGSDKPFLRAIACTLAAFRPDVKARLVEEGLLMPAFQMIFRMCNKGVRDENTYRTGKAHPTAFPGETLDVLGMVKMAHDITLETIPPMVQLTVLEEDEYAAGVDYFEPPGLVEKLADTPAAIARVVRARRYLRKMVVSARDSFDVNDRDLTCRWAVLRGDRSRIKIVPRDKRGFVVELHVPFHERRPIYEGAELESSRVDIGVFVHNGVHFSAPGFVTFFTIPSEGRTYRADGRPLEIYYTAGSGMIDDNAVTNWVALFDAMLDEGNAFGHELVKERLTAGERGRLREVAHAYGALHDAMRDARIEYAAAEKAVKPKRKALNEAKAALKKAEQAAKGKSSEQVEKRVETAKARYEEARKTHDEAAKRLAVLRAAADQAKKKAGRFIRDTRLDGARSVADRILRVLDALKDDVGLFVRHADRALHRVTALKGNPSGETVARVVAELEERGILVKSDAGWVLRSVREGGGPITERLTGYERDHLHRLNLVLLTQVAFPGCLDAPYTKNFCDLFITTRKPWRDVYRYDRDGRCTGWTRFIGGRQDEFTAEGRLVVERDSEGRVKVARAVRYGATPPIRIGRGRALLKYTAVP